MVQGISLQSIQSLQKNVIASQQSHIVLSQINALHCQQNKLEHKGGLREVHDACTVAAVVGKKARLKTWRC